MKPPTATMITARARGLEGSPNITGWCPGCEVRAVPMRDLSCGFCGTKLDREPPAPPEPDHKPEPDLECRLPWLPITRTQLDIAISLRRDGLSYPAIAVVMRRYHDLSYHEERWRHWLRHRGGMAPAKGGSRQARELRRPINAA